MTRRLLVLLLMSLPLVVPAAPLPVLSPPPAGAQATVTVMAAGDISPDPSSSKDDDVATSNLILAANPTAVLTLGDNQYPQGELADFRHPDGYEGSWGRFRARTRPSPGNHDYDDPAGEAAGYFGYFGALAGDPARGYYSFDLGDWHIISLNSNCGGGGSPSCARDSAQVRWLQADLASNSRLCTLAYWHHPRFTHPAGHEDDARTQYFWNALYAAHADIILAGHNHVYERFGALHPLGRLGAGGAGVRAFTVGTGGNSLYRFRTPPRESSRYRDDGHYGVVRLTLSPTSWRSEFRRTDGQVADQAAAGCWR
jgi:acid phosphatase type 7